MKKYHFYLFVPLFLTAVALTSCSSDEKSAPAPKAAEQKMEAPVEESQEAAPADAAAPAEAAPTTEAAPAAEETPATNSAEEN